MLFSGLGVSGRIFDRIIHRNCGLSGNPAFRLFVNPLATNAV
jgi:hypothetical protein